MWWQFISQNTHFAINLFAALVCLGICWLYIDAWSNRHHKKELFKWLGFASLGLSFLIQATVIEQAVLGESLFGDITPIAVTILRIIGYAGVIFGNIIDPLQKVPKNTGLALEALANAEIESEKYKNENTQNTAKTPSVLVGGSGGSGLGTYSNWLLPVGGLAVAFLYWRRATTGLERHLKPVAYGFLLIALSDFIALAQMLRDTSNPVLYSWVAAFGVIWWIEHLLLLAATIILGIWTWFYLTKRFFTQLYMIFMGMTAAIFLLVSVGFTTLLLRNVQSTALTNLETAGQVLNYALQSRQSEAASAAAQLAGGTRVIQAVDEKDRIELARITKDFMVDKGLSSFLITSESGQVLLRGEDSERWGDSLSSEPLVKRALLGINQSTVTVREGVGSPVVQIRSGVAILDDNDEVIGSVVTSLDLDSAFVDGLKETTGLQSSVYGGNTLAATTFVAPDGQSRTLGVSLVDEEIQRKVIEEGQGHSGQVNLQNRQMLAAFVPIKDVDNATVGMLLVAMPQSQLLATAGRSVELTFLLSVILIIFSLMPTYFITRNIVRQLD